MANLITDASQIKARNVRLILPEGNVIMDKNDALAKASADGMDLVLVQEGDLPVVKLVDYVKLEYDREKNTKTNRPKKPKTIQIGPHTQEYDLKRFAIQAVEFIKEGHPTSVRLEVKGRDKTHRDIITKQIQDFVVLVSCAKPGKLHISEDGSSYSQSLN